VKLSKELAEALAFLPDKESRVDYLATLQLFRHGIPIIGIELGSLLRFVAASDPMRSENGWVAQRFGDVLEGEPFLVDDRTADRDLVVGALRRTPPPDPDDKTPKLLPSACRIGRCSHREHREGDGTDSRLMVRSEKPLSIPSVGWSALTADRMMAHISKTMGVMPEYERTAMNRLIGLIWALQYVRSRQTPGVAKSVVNLPPQVGKAVCVDELMLTPAGFVRNGDLVAGDVVYGPDGQERKVSHAHPTSCSSLSGGAFRVTTTDGRSIVVNGDHLWTVNNKDWTANDGWKTLSTAALVAAGVSKPNRSSLNGKSYTTKSYRFRLPRQHAIEGRSTDLSVDPYTLGVWLGDGHTADGRVTFGLNDADWIAPRCRYDIKLKRHQTSNSEQGTFLGLAADLRDAGVLGNKHIPAAYHSASIAQRLQLLRGLMDTDGYAGGDRSHVEITLMDKRLAGDVKTLAVGLGFRVSFTEGRATIDGVDKGPKWRIGWTCYDGDPNPFTLPRKAESVSYGSQRPGVSIANIEPISDRPMRCITVDHEDGLYLAGRDLVPTHNSTIAHAQTLWMLSTAKGRLQVITASHSDNLAVLRGVFVREILGEANNGLSVTVASDDAARDKWRTVDPSGYIIGGLRSVGIGSKISGHPADAMLLDDLADGVGDAIGAKGESVWRTVSSSLAQRLQSRAWLSVLATRWAAGDVPGRYLDLEGQDFCQVVIPAVHDDPKFDDPLGRELGEVAVPERFTLAQTHQRIRVLGGLESPLAQALYQQKPAAISAGHFKREMWGMVSLDPADLLYLARGWDLAGTEGGGDATAGVLVGVTVDGQVCIVDIFHDRLGTGGVRDAMRRVAEADADSWEVPLVHTIEQQPGAAGLDMRMTQESLLDDVVDLDFVKPSGSKVARAYAASSRQLVGGLFISDRVPAAHIQTLVKESEAFPGAAHDDIVDALAMAVNTVLFNPPRKTAGSLTTSAATRI